MEIFWFGVWEVAKIELGKLRKYAFLGKTLRALEVSLSRSARWDDCFRVANALVSAITTFYQINSDFSIIQNAFAMLFTKFGEQQANLELKFASIPDELLCWRRKHGPKTNGCKWQVAGGMTAKCERICMLAIFLSTKMLFCKLFRRITSLVSVSLHLLSPFNTEIDLENIDLYRFALCYRRYRIP